MTRVLGRLGYPADVPCMNGDKSAFEKFLEIVVRLIARGQELIPISIAAHGHKVNDSPSSFDGFFFYPSGCHGPSPFEEVSLEKWILHFMYALSSLVGGSTILFIIDCCRCPLQLTQEQEAQYRNIVQPERRKYAGRDPVNKVMIFWASGKRSPANEDPIRSQSFFTTAWNQVLSCMTAEECDEITLKQIFDRVIERTAALARAADVSQKPEFDPPLDLSWPILNLRPLAGAEAPAPNLLSNRRNSMLPDQCPSIP